MACSAWITSRLYFSGATRKPDRKPPARVRATPEHLRTDRLLLLEEGHCLRDQALAVCQLRKADHIDTFGASSLSTLVQMVANGMGITLLPEISLSVEAGHHNVQLMRFAPPEPRRVVGLAWRASSPRNRDFEELARFARNIAPRSRRLQSASRDH